MQSAEKAASAALLGSLRSLAGAFKLFGGGAEALDDAGFADQAHGFEEAGRDHPARGRDAAGVDELLAGDAGRSHEFAGGFFDRLVPEVGQARQTVRVFYKNLG